ncbi:hypothetical protein BGW80DRAFT_181493 [Lactifluus volemus]|nr:hypothetical protein BGW80DRAFT_181493 [Lactifluus volemus]
MPTQPHTQANEDSIEGTPTTGAVTDFTGRLNALFSMYNEQAEIQDRKMVERLKGEADGMLHASSLFSIIVSILLGMSYQTFSQAASQVNLAQICHLNTCQKNPLIRLPSDPSDPSAVIHSPTASAIWVNALWSLCLVISLSCFLFASLLQHWIRRYLHIVQMPRSPQRRVRIRELMTQGIDKHYLLWVAAALPSLFHISVFLFLAGLLVSLSSTMPAVFMVISAGVGVCALLYLAFSLSPILHYDSPFYTPLSSLIWSTIVGIPWLILNLIYRVTERLNFIGYRTRFRVLDLARTFHQLTFMGMMKAVEDLASTRVLELDTPALLRTFDSLEGDQDMEKFLVGLPGFYSSTEVEKDAQALEHLHSHQLPSAIVAFMDRSWSSNVLSEDDKRRRIKICLDVMNMDPLFLQCTFRQTLLSTGSSLFECADFVIGAESHYGNPDLWTRHYAQCIVAVAISRVQEFSGSWQDIAQRQQDSFQVPLKKASWNADSMKLINFIWIAWILKASYLTSSDQFEPDRMWHNVLSETLKFNASGTSSELWEHFCNLWNSLVAVTKDSPGYLMARANAGSFLSLLSATHPLFHPGAALTVAAPYSQCHIDTHQLPTSHLVEKVSDTEATHPRPRSTSPTLVRSPEDDARPYDVESPTLDTVRLPLSDAEATLKNPNPQEETIQKPSYAEDTLQSRGFLSQILTGTIGPHQPSRPMMLGERVPQGYPGA